MTDRKLTSEWTLSTVNVSAAKSGAAARAASKTGTMRSLRTMWGSPFETI